ncbi:MAG: condensation domain-containing protein, partial [Bradymonadaceae bacterium]
MTSSDIRLEDVEDVYGLSPLQTGMLVESIKRPDAGIYIVQATLTFDRLVPPQRLQEIWDRILERHEILRSEFYWQG